MTICDTDIINDDMRIWFTITRWMHAESTPVNGYYHCVCQMLTFNGTSGTTLYLVSFVTWLQNIDYLN